jgi:hypothetical protein
MLLPEIKPVFMRGVVYNKHVNVNKKFLSRVKKNSGLRADLAFENPVQNVPEAAR